AGRDVGGRAELRDADLGLPGKVTEIVDRLDARLDLENEGIDAGELGYHDKIGPLGIRRQGLRAADLGKRHLTGEHGGHALRARDVGEVHVKTVLVEEAALLRGP